MYFNNKFFHLSIYKNKHLNWKFLEKINDIDNVIDIGAAEGTLPLVYNFPNANYYLFEPLKIFNDKLISFNKKNNILKYQIFNVALSNKIGLADFYHIEGAPNSSSVNKPNDYWSGVKKDSTVKVEVSMNKLSDFKDKINFDNSLIKIDTQGNEFKVLQGINDDIFKKVKFFIMEQAFHKRYQTQCLFDNVFMLLREKGFKVAGVIDTNNQIKASVVDFLFCKNEDDRSYF